MDNTFDNTCILRRYEGKFVSIVTDSLSCKIAHEEVPSSGLKHVVQIRREKILLP
jgi:hypothetical protein